MNNDKIVLRFDVLWKGWELDDIAWVKEKENGDRYLVMTSHGGEYPAQASELLDRIRAYESALAQTKEALRLLGVNF